MKFLGFEIKRASDDVKTAPSIVPHAEDDGALAIAPGGAYGTYVDMDGSVRGEAQLIARYREMASHPEVDNAIDDIVNEAIVQEANERPVTINLDDTLFSDDIRDIIRAEFDVILSILRFNTFGYDTFRRWYIDGRLYFFVVIDPENPLAGIKDLRYVDPRKMRKIRESKKNKVSSEIPVQVITYEKEYFIYNEKGFGKAQGTVTSTAGSGVEGLKVAKDSVVYVTSGVLDKNHTTIVSHLHKAIKPLNQLRALEDAVVIYRISRAPERRIFYIDVGNLPKMKAEQYLSDIMLKFKNKLVYDASTGEVRDDRKFMCYALDTKIPLLDGRTLEIQELIKEYNSGKQNWVYSCDPITGEFVPGPLTWAGITKRDSEVVKVTFDNGKSVTCTPDHKFPVWNKGFIEAKDLAIGESLIPGYRREKEITKGGVKYEQIFKNDTKTWEFTHREVAKWNAEHCIDKSLNHNIKYVNHNKSIVHHENFNRYDNSPYNLVMMNHKDHLEYHRDIQSILYTDEILKAVDDCAQNLMNVKDTITTVNDNVNLLEWINKNINRHPKNRDVENLIFTRKDLIRICILQGFNGWKDYRNDYDNREKENNGRVRRSETYKFSAEWKEKLSVAAKQRKPHCKTWKIKSPDGNIEIIENLNKYCRENSLNRNNIKRDYGSRGYHAEHLHNHKVVSVEFLDETMEVAALTIDNNETYHSHHTYLLDAGVYTKNTMLEDFWLPRREGGRGTEISTLPAGQNLGEMEDVKYFLKKLYKSLNVPEGRMESEQSFSIGRGTEISRDEIKFAKFINRLRARFSDLFIYALEKQLILKNHITVEEWEANFHNIRIDFKQDNYYSELKEADIMSQRLSTLEGLQPWMGKDGFFSRAWIQQNVLKMTSDEIQAMAAELEADQQQEIESYVEKQILYGQANQKLIQMGVMPPPEDPNAESK